MKILFLVPYPPGESPSQRFRFEQYFAVLSAAGFHFTIESFLTHDNWKIFYSQGKGLEKLIALALGFMNRLATLFKAPAYDFVFIHREAMPLGPPLFEWFIAKVLRKPIIYDFDDAIWLTDSAQESLIRRILKWRRKVADICAWSYKVSCGNEFLCSFARKYNPSVVLLPTTIDTRGMHVPPSDARLQNDKLIIGWTGSHTTLKYVEAIESALSSIVNRNNHVRVCVIADRPPGFSFKGWDFISWNKDNEIQDLASFDIGIMPLPDDDWSKGKCGFKALQYMALGIPAVVSPVGVNTTIVREGVEGFHARNETEWIDRLQTLVDDRALRKTLGRAGRERVLDHYSVEANSGVFLSLFS